MSAHQDDTAHQPNGLLSLPRELRDNIWRYAAVPTYAVELTTFCIEATPGTLEWRFYSSREFCTRDDDFVSYIPIEKKDCITSRRHYTNIRSINKQIHDEVDPIFSAEAEFRVQIYYSAQRSRSAQLPPQVPSNIFPFIRHIDIEVPMELCFRSPFSTWVINGGTTTFASLMALIMPSATVKPVMSLSMATEKSAAKANWSLTLRNSVDADTRAELGWYWEDPAFLRLFDIVIPRHLNAALPKTSSNFEALTTALSAVAPGYWAMREDMRDLMDMTSDERQAMTRYLLDLIDQEIAGDPITAEAEQDTQPGTSWQWVSWPGDRVRAFLEAVNPPSRGTLRLPRLLKMG